MTFSKVKKILFSSIFKNFSSLASGEIISKGILFLVVVYLARVLGPENFGKLGFAQAFLSYFGLIVNLGLDVYGAREIARDKTRAKELLNNIIAMKVLLFILTYILLFIIVSLLPKDLLTKKVILIYGLTLFTTALTIDWFFQGFENFKAIAVGRIIRNLVYATLVILFVRHKDQVLDAVFFQICGAVVSVLVLWSLVLEYFDLKQINFSKWKEYGKIGIILGSSFFMISIYYNLDKLMIGFWYPDKYVGWYDAAYRVVMISLMLSSLLWSTFLPKIARWEKVLFIFVKTMLGVGFSLFLILYFFNSYIIRFLFGESYLYASKALMILAFNVFLVYVNISFVSPLTVWNRERVYFLVIASGALTNLILNFLLIPKYDIIGASIATVMAELSVFIFGFPIFLKMVRKHYVI